MRLHEPPPMMTPTWYPSYGQYGWLGFDTGFMPLKSVFEVALCGQEDHYTVGIFIAAWDARTAAAKALLAYRKWCRSHLDDLLSPRGLDLHATIRSHRINASSEQWWEK